MKKKDRKRKMKMDTNEAKLNKGLLKQIKQVKKGEEEA